MTIYTKLFTGSGLSARGYEVISTSDELGDPTFLLLGSV
jgi:hypothetical protein